MEVTVAKPVTASHWTKGRMLWNIGLALRGELPKQLNRSVPILLKLCRVNDLRSRLCPGLDATGRSWKHVQGKEPHKAAWARARSRRECALPECCCSGIAFRGLVGLNDLLSVEDGYSPSVDHQDGAERERKNP